MLKSLQNVSISKIVFSGTVISLGDAWLSRVEEVVFVFVFVFFNAGLLIVFDLFMGIEILNEAEGAYNIFWYK